MVNEVGYVKGFKFISEFGKGIILDICIWL